MHERNNDSSKRRRSVPLGRTTAHSSKPGAPRESRKSVKAYLHSSKLEEWPVPVEEDVSPTDRARCCSRALEKDDVLALGVQIVFLGAQVLVCCCCDRLWPYFCFRLLFSPWSCLFSLSRS
jgi:hypothetical protein